MNNEEKKQIKLAEFAGWKGIVQRYLIGYAPWHRVTYEERVKKTLVEDFWAIPLDPLPNYFHDMNEVHELEQKAWAQDHGLREVFVDHLARILNRGHGYRMHSAEELLDATAAQRCEALGLTLNLWTP